MPPEWREPGCSVHALLTSQQILFRYHCFHVRFRFVFVSFSFPFSFPFSFSGRIGFSVQATKQIIDFQFVTLWSTIITNIVIIFLAIASLILSCRYEDTSLLFYDVDVVVVVDVEVDVLYW